MVRVFQEYKTATINIFKKFPVCVPQDTIVIIWILGSRPHPNHSQEGFV